MSAVVLGISGSPIPNSNTDRAVREVLDATGLDCEFIKLSNLDIQPCRACLGCKDTNQCVVKDDGPELAEKFRQAKALVVGAFTPYCSLDARTKTFMERMYCLRHRAGFNRGKFAAAIITTGAPVEAPFPGFRIASEQIGMWMMEEGMVNLGIMQVVGNVPCIRCGYGDTCEQSGVRMVHGPQATVESIGVRKFPQNQTLLGQARDLGATIRQAVIGSAGKAQSLKVMTDSTSE